jgi:hypothetical protein
MKEMENNSRVLACDRAGNPSAWLNNEMAVHLVATDRVLAPLKPGSGPVNETGHP